MPLIIKKCYGRNEHEILSNCILMTQKKAKKLAFYCRFTVHSHSRVFNNELTYTRK